MIPSIGVEKLPHTQNLLTGAIRASALPAYVAYALLVIDGGGRLRVKAYISLSCYNNFPGFPATPWENRLFAHQGYVVHAAGGFTHLILVEWHNGGFNFTSNAPTLVVGDVTSYLIALEDPEDILETMNPAAANL